LALEIMKQTGESLLMQKDFAAAADPRIARYVEETFHPRDNLLQEVVDRTMANGLPQIQVAAMDGLHLEVLARAAGARKIVEIGTLAGYSGVCLARALPADGMLYTFEMDPKHARQAEETFRRAGVTSRVELRIGPALEKLREIEAKGPFDLVFIDADKISYPDYFDWAARFLKVGGLLVADNTLAWGLIADESFPTAEKASQVRGIRELNARAARDPRFRATLLPSGEGLTVAVRTA
jgi:caffeoyl-CoA O-methyltransferase